MLQTNIPDTRYVLNELKRFAVLKTSVDEFRISPVGFELNDTLDHLIKRWIDYFPRDRDLLSPSYQRRPKYFKFPADGWDFTGADSEL